MMAENTEAIEQPQGELLSEGAPPESGEQSVSPDPSDESEHDSALSHLVVGIGVPAGGVETCIELFNHLAPDTGMAFVIIPEFLAGDKLDLAEVLSTHTPMPVANMNPGVQPCPDHVYFLPPGRHVQLKRGAFWLETVRSANGEPHPIDHFLSSLAASQRIRAVGIVLAGTQGDGALGLRAIREEGGIAIAQGPDTGASSEKQRGGISLEYVDRILSLEQIAFELGQIGRQFKQPGLKALEEGTRQPAEELASTRILNLLRGVCGIDFRLYKNSAVWGRIARRMLMQRVQSVAEYAAFLQESPKELWALHEDALVGTTRFFRDPPVFVALREVILPRILTNRAPDQTLRIWVAGCNAGEEVYSIAICLLEYLAAQEFEIPIQIFGTDASEHSIQKARIGIYPESVAEEISPERLRRFFVKVPGGYQISKQVREWCVFAQHNLLQDPPLSKIDLISCRNVLINLAVAAQRKILPTFHYALRPDGILLLGIAETTREFAELFQLIDRRHKFFGKIGDVVPRTELATMPSRQADASAKQAPAANWTDKELRRSADRIVLARYGPPGVVIDDQLRIRQSRGHTAPFLEMPQGPVSLKITRMLRDSIAGPVSQAVQKAVEQDLPVRVEGLRTSDADQPREFAVEVLPIRTSAARPRCFLVLFTPSHPSEPRETQENRQLPDSADKDELLKQLRQELASTKFYLQTLLDERDARNQELVLANEEIESVNRAMQSANEELDNIREELRVANEELQTVQDLEQRNASLSRTVDDFSNLLNSVNLPVLLLSSELHIRHFTAFTQRLMSLRLPDIGRPFSDIRVNLRVDNIEAILREVLDTLTPRELEVQDSDGRWHLLRVGPYRTADNRIEGVVLVMVDVDQFRRARQELRVALDVARTLIENVPLPLAVIDLGFRMRLVNEAFRNLAATRKGELEGRSFPDLASALWGIEEPLRSHLESLRASLDANNQFRFQFQTPGDKPRVLDIRGSALRSDGESHLLITVEDISAQKEVERILILQRERLAGEVASTARELGRTQDELRALAASLFTSQEEERRRVARELHDDISQKLALLEIDAQQVEPQIATDPIRARKELERVRIAVGDLSEEVRRISHALHPSVIEDLGVTPAIRSLVEDFRDREDMIVTFQAENVPEGIPVEIATGLYRITQEALRNTAKHAGRTHVKVILAGEPGRIRLQAIDAGKGFDPRANRSGLGLISMQERARILRGKLTIESKVGEGTRVTVDVPLP